MIWVIRSACDNVIISTGYRSYFFGFLLNLSECFVPEACQPCLTRTDGHGPEIILAIRLRTAIDCNCVLWTSSYFKRFWMLGIIISIYLHRFRVRGLCGWPWSPQYHNSVWASASSITINNDLRKSIGLLFCQADEGACCGRPFSCTWWGWTITGIQIYWRAHSYLRPDPGPEALVILCVFTHCTEACPLHNK